MKAQSRWIGVFPDGETIVWASELQGVDDPDWVTLWSYESKQTKRYLCRMVKQVIKPYDDPVNEAEVIKEFMAFLASLVEERDKKIRERYEEKQNHLGNRPAELRRATHKKQRVTHCWSCKEHLDSRSDLECSRCNWILCRCGACGCGFFT